SRYTRLLLERGRAGGGVNDRQARLQFTSTSRQRRPIHPARQIDIRQQNVDRRTCDLRESIGRVGHAVDSKSLSRERFCNPLPDEEFILDKEDADPLSVRYIYASVNAHGSHPPFHSRLMRCAKKRSNWQKTSQLCFASG